MNYFSLIALLVSLSLTPVLQGADYEYELRWLNPITHTYLIGLHTAPQTTSYTDFRIPAWRPGRYIMQDYAAAVSHFEAKDEAGNVLSWRKVDKDTWRVQHGALEEVRIRYQALANNPDAGSSFLGREQAYFNPINLFMHVVGRMEGSVQLTVPQLPADWEIATALVAPGARNVFQAASYHEFADSPTVLAKEIKQLSFEDQGTTFYLHFHGNYEGDAAVDQEVIRQVRKICQEQAALFRGYPFAEYHFIYRLLSIPMRHAVEHSNSASFALPSTSVSSVKRVKGGLLGITSHEFWHVWNVKRIRPAALWPYDYSGPQYTTLHWFTEGVTDYYTNLTLVRAGITTEEEYFRTLSRTLASLENSYAASVISPSASSFNSWLATSPYAHPHHRISYYTLGSRLGLMLDLALRTKSQGTHNLDDVFRYLYKTYYQQDQGIPENGVQQAMESLTGASWQAFFDRYVHGTEAYDYAEFFTPFGLKLKVVDKENPGKRGIGISRVTKASQGLLVKRLTPGGDAFQAGLGEEEIILEIEGQQARELDLDDFVNGLKKGAEIRMKVLVGFSEVKELSLTYTGAFSGKEYHLESMEKLSTEQQRMRADWLSSKQ